ncbi:MAG: M48 family metalloprotease [Planctomycetes bacterium]|nr:M48 family metalloprotease [Planctomycetota bacterium]
MPQTFFEVERRKGRAIGILFAIVLAIYVGAFGVLLWLIGLVIHLYSGARPAWFSGWRWAVLTVAVALAAALLHWLLSRRDPIPRLAEALRARAPDPQDRYHHRLTHILEELSVAGGGRTFQPLVIPTTAMNAFAVSDLRGGCAIGVTEGLLSRLDRAPLQAVLAHEAAYVLSGDCDLATASCLLFGVYTGITRPIDRAIEMNVEAKGHFGGGGGLLPLLGIRTLACAAKHLSTFVNLAISRERLIRADAAAVRLTRDPLSLAEALRDMARRWTGIGQIPDGLSPLFTMDVTGLRFGEDEGALATLFSAHPPVRRRIKALLDQAHVRGIDAVAFMKGGRIRAAPGESDGTGTASDPSPEERVWWAKGADGWIGPLVAAQLVAVGGFGPQMWVRMGEDGAPFPAGSAPALAALIASGIPERIRSGRDCPRCHQPLVRAEFEGAPVERCPFCRGHLLPRDQVKRVIARRERTDFPEEAHRLADNIPRVPPTRADRASAEAALCCPGCGETMGQEVYSYAYPIPIDRCSRCRLEWYDRNELEAIQIVIERAEAAG